MGASGKIKGKHAIAVMTALVAFLAVCAAFLALVAIQTQKTLRAEAVAYVSSLDEVSRHIDRVITVLQPVQPCTPAFQKLARQQVFSSHTIHDILAVDEMDRPICSASEGPLVNQSPLPVPKMLAWHNQRAIWHELPLALYDGQKTSWAIREGNILVIADMVDHTSVPESGAWEVRASTTGRNSDFHVRGVEGVQERYMQIRGIPVLSQFAAYECSTIEYACITRLASAAGVWRTERPLIIAGLVLAVAIAAMAYSTASRWLDRLASKPRRIERGLKSGKGFYCVYQPIVDMRTGSTTGCEVLARFEDQYGTIGPTDFVPMVQELGKSWDFTEHILGIAISDLEGVVTASPDFSISVNFYPEDIRDSRLEIIRQSPSLKDAASRRIRINCEVLETGFGLSESRQEVCRYFRECGFTIAIDDFGTGASNLQQLHDLQPDYVKIDRSFISGSGLDGSGVRTSLIPHIIAIANSVEAEVIAEGIETYAQAQLMRNMGVRLAQGYFYSYPLSLEAFVKYLANEPQRLASRVTSIR